MGWNGRSHLRAINPRTAPSQCPTSVWPGRRDRVSRPVRDRLDSVPGEVGDSTVGQEPLRGRPGAASEPGPRPPSGPAAAGADRAISGARRLGVSHLTAPFRRAGSVRFAVRTVSMHTINMRKFASS